MAYSPDRSRIRREGETPQMTFHNTAPDMSSSVDGSEEGKPLADIYVGLDMSPPGGTKENIAAFSDDQNEVKDKFGSDPFGNEEGNKIQYKTLTWW